MDSINPADFQNEKIAIENLPQYEEVTLDLLSKKYLLKLNVGTSVFLLICVAIVLAANYFYNGCEAFLPYIFVGLLLFFVWLFYCNYQLSKRNSFAVRERDLIFKRGFVFEKTTIVPFNRVQHVSTNRGVLDKLLNLSTLKIFTAGGSGSDISIPALPPETAENLKQTLAERMSGYA